MLRSLIFAAALVAAGSATYACSESKGSGSERRESVEWTSPIPKLEMTCGESTCL